MLLYHSISLYIHTPKSSRFPVLILNTDYCYLLVAGGTKHQVTKTCQVESSGYTYIVHPLSQTRVSKKMGVQGGCKCQPHC